MNYSIPPVEDDVDPSPSVVCEEPSGSTFPLGDTPVECKATDAAGNIASKILTVTVEDTTPPEITLVGENPQVIEGGDAYSELGAVASDIVDGDVTGSIVIDASAVDTAAGELSGDLQRQ